MKLELDIWQVVILGSMILGAFWGMAKMLMAQASKALDEKLALFGRQLDLQTKNDQHLERQLADLRAELPREFVRRDDFIRAIAGSDMRIDQLRLTIERAMLERKGHHS